MSRAADGKVTFSEFKDFYMDYTLRTHRRRRETTMQRLETSPRGHGAKKKWQSKVNMINNIRSLGLSSSTAPPDSLGKGKQLWATMRRTTTAMPMTPRRVQRSKAHITDTRSVTDGSGGIYTVYILDVTRFDGSSYQLAPKRFSDFFQLRGALVQAARPGVERLPFPKRKASLRKSNAERTVAKRREILESWLNEVLLSCSCDPELSEFMRKQQESQAMEGVPPPVKNGLGRRIARRLSIDRGGVPFSLAGSATGRPALRMC